MPSSVAVPAAPAGLGAHRAASVRVPLHAGQMDAWLSPARHVFLIAGTGGGKTVFGPRWLYREIKRFAHEPVETQSYLVFDPSYKVLKRATLPAYLRFFQALGLGRFKRAELVYELRNGANVYFGSCDNSESLEGLHVRAAHGDEIGQDSVSLTVWETVRRRLGFYEGRFLGTTTPYNLGWLKRHVVDPWRAGQAPDTDVVNFSSIANPAYPVEEFERRRREMPAWAFRMFYLGEFERPMGLVYDLFDEREHVVDDFPVPFNWPRFGGLDFGLKHPTGFLAGALAPNDVLYVYAEYRRAERATPEHVKDIKALGEVRRIWADPRSVQLIADYRAHGLKAEKGKAGQGDVLAGIQEVYTRLKSGRLKVFRSLVHWREEVERYSWMKDADGEPMDKPIEHGDELMDCTRYLCMGLKTSGTADLPEQRADERTTPIAAGIRTREF